MTSEHPPAAESTGRSTTVVGVDGCRGGWITVEWSIDAGELQADRVDDLAPLIDRLRSGDLQAMAVDMPMGLLDRQPRTCDTQARKLLGPRRSSIFPTPVRATLGARDYRHACQLSAAVSGKALSKQAFNLLPKIRELDQLIEPADQDRLVEAHPECAFVRLAGRPLEHPKRTEAGRAQRRLLLHGHDPSFGALLDHRSDLPVLDLIDAAVLAITAARVATGTERRLISAVDRRGLVAQIVY